MNRLSEISIIRAIACIFVVTTHSITNFLKNVEVDLNGEDHYILWIRFSLLCATPIFILLSETLISRSYADKLPKGFFSKRIKFILIPYILIGMIESYRRSAGDFSSFIEVFVHKVIWGNWYGFFVLVIFQFYILHLLIGKFLMKLKPVYPLVLSFIISYTHLYSFVNHPVYKEFILTNYPFWHRTHILVWLFFFIAAFYIGQYYDRIMEFLNNKIWIPVVASITTYLVIMYDVLEVGYTRVASDRYDMLLYSVSVFFMLAVLIRKFKINHQGLVMVSHFSYFIYLTHMIVLPYFVKLSLMFGENFFSYVGIMTFLSIATPIGWTMLFYQNRMTRLFTGKVGYLDNR